MTQFGVFLPVSGRAASRKTLMQAAHKAGYYDTVMWIGGILMKANAGKRYLSGQWPTSDPNAFDPNGAVFTSDTPYTAADAPKHEQDGQAVEYGTVLFKVDPS